MPRGKRQPIRQSTRATRQSARQCARDEDAIPEIYVEMLAEVAAEERAAASKPPRTKAPPNQTARLGRAKPADGVPGLHVELPDDSSAEERASSTEAAFRPSKRRKVSEEPSSKIELDFDLFGGSAEPIEAAKTQQVAFRELDTEDESEEDFEDVDLEATVEQDFNDEPEKGPLELNLFKAPVTPSRAAQRRKPVTGAERKLRLALHKSHLVMLLAHLSCRNQWCNREFLQAILKPLVTRKTISLLHPDEAKSQYDQNQSFSKGLEELCDLWSQAWTVDGRGMQRAYWRDDIDALKESDESEDPVDFDDFKAAAVSRQGSRDLAAQLFCALLRSVAVEARLVCSLQVLPFSGVAKGQTPEKPKTDYIYAPPQDYNSTPGSSTARRSKSFPRSQYPIFWVEVFSPALQTWVPVDTVVRNTINKPKTGFEPPSSDALNRMIYVIAFDDDGYAKDITMRYTQFFNSKIRKQRVESTTGGEQWWERTMRVFEKAFREPRDHIEDAALIRKSEAEPMPRNIQDFKGHSIYVLERHLHLNQVIQPKREVGKVNVGANMKTAKLESVFRRKDVHICRTADAWYRRGRDVKEGEQPLKRVMPKRRRTPTADEADEDDVEAAEGSALYAEFQTGLYEPPPIVEGKVPRNAFKNLDVYVPSMIPAGGVHVRHPLAAQAARILGIDYADAVTGFQFKGRQGTAIIDGIVVSMTMTNAMINVVEGLEEQASEEAQAARSRIVLAMWKRWLAALRIREHVQREYGGLDEGAATKHQDVDEDDDEEDTSYQPEDDGGGFMLEKDDYEGDGRAMPFIPAEPPDLRPPEKLLPPEVVHQEIVIVRSLHKLPQPPALEPKDEQIPAEDATSIFDNTDEGGGFMAEDDQTESKNVHTHEAADNEAGGGFLPEEDDQEGGGFFADEEDKDNDQAGGFLPDAEIKESSIGPTATAQVTGEEVVPVPVLILPPGKDEAAESKTAQSAHEQASPASTVESRLSHDPDEDDAEPEWLLNGLGEIE